VGRFVGVPALAGCSRASGKRTRLFFSTDSDKTLPRATLPCYDNLMKTITEIEDAIEKLPFPQIDELAVWIESLRARRIAPKELEAWLQRARGAAHPGMTTEKIMALTRAEE
jgi:hypothetical protein